MKNFSFYYKKGMVLAKMAMKGKSLFTKMLLGLYLILSTFGKLFLFLRPIFIIADNNLAMMIVEGHDFEINKLFEGINRKKRYSSVLLSTLFIEGIVLVSAVLLLLPYVIWALYPTLYNLKVSPYIFLSVFSFGVAALSLALGLVYSPLGFVACKGKDLSVGDMLFLSKEGSKSVKGKVVGLEIIHNLIISLVIAALIFAAYFVGLYTRDNNGEVYIFANFIIMGLFVLLAFLDVFFLSFFRLSLLVSLYSIFFDNVEAKHIIVARRGVKGDQFVPLFADDKEEM